jgi:methylmalonyl-CoA mutase
MFHTVVIRINRDAPRLSFLPSFLPSFLFSFFSTQQQKRATGLPKLRIEECSARQQARIDSGRQIIVGVNKYVDTASSKEPLHVRHIDNTAVLANQKQRLESLRAKRHHDAVDKTLSALEAAARAAQQHAVDSPTATAATNGGDLDRNLLKLAIDAARARATVGEISSALERAWGRYEADTSVSTGTYRSEMGAATEAEVAAALAATEQFERTEGRRPRVLIAKMGMDGHDRGARVMATGLADLGFDVDVGPLFMTPEEVARHAIDADVHMVSFFFVIDSFFGVIFVVSCV